MKRIKILLLLLMMAVCMAGSGCAERKSASEQGELVRNQGTVGEIRQSFISEISLLRKKVSRFTYRL